MVRAPSIKAVQPLVWLALGTAGAVNELFIRTGTERPYALAFCATLLGIPALLSWDRKAREKDE